MRGSCDWAFIATFWTAFNPFSCYSVFAGSQRQWTLISLNQTPDQPQKDNNYLTVSQEEVMDKVAEMYTTNNSFLVYVFAASWPDRKLTFWSDTANTTKLICVRSLPSLFLWWHRHCSYEVDYEDCGPDFRLSFMILVTFGFLHLVPSSSYSSRY